MQFFTTWVWAGGPIWLNLQAFALKGDYVWIPVAVLIGAAAPVSCYMIAVVEHKAWRMIALLCVVVAAAYNITTAIGSASEHRLSVAAPKRALIERRESMLRRDAQLADKIAKIGWRLNGDTSFSISSALDQIKLTSHYLSSDGCRDVRKRDPDRVCYQLREAEGRLAEAKQVEVFEAEREQIRKNLLKVEDPATDDPQLATLIQLLSPVYKIDTDLLSAILSGIGPIVLELLGTFVPAVFGRFWSERNKHATCHMQNGYSVIQKAPTESLSALALEKPEKTAETGHSVIHNALQNAPTESPPADRYISVCLEPDTESHLVARSIYTECAKWCRNAKIKAPTEAEFKRAMEDHGYTRRLINRRQHYENVRLRTAKLMVVS